MSECLHPRTIRVPQGSKLTKSTTTQFIQVRCGKCVGCLKNYMSSWVARLELQSRSSNYSYFVTLTYNEENNPINVNKRDITLYFKKLRKFYNFQFFKYYLISEYGPETGRPHYHFLCWSDVPIDFESKWNKGFVTTDVIIPQRIAYVCAYHILKNDNVPLNCLPNFRLMSKGLGLDGFKDYELDNAVSNGWTWYLNDSMQIAPIHRYFRKKFDVHLDFIPDNSYPLMTKQQIIDLNSTIDYELLLFKEQKFRKKFKII